MENISVNDVGRIVEALRNSTGSDFGNYAFSSLRRRIIRFTEIKRIREVGILVENINADKGFAENFIEEITVNVTEMFRDPSFWKMLRDVVFPVIGKKSAIKIWHAACATGEEVVSMAIMLHEAGLLEKTKITATDISRNVLKTAATGNFKLKNQEVNSKNYDLVNGKRKLADYFKIADNQAKFDSFLLKNTEFMRHDLAKDEAFSVFDLVLCRNVLIYFNSDLQERVLSTLNRSLETGSFLAIGSKESIRWCREAYCFHEESIEEKIYRKITDRKTSPMAN